MRIISGSAKGRRLALFKDSLIRPTSDRIREAIFNILSNPGIVTSGAFPFSNVLDIFAGTGALGIETLSRGALKGVFIESNTEALKVLAKNIQICNFHDRAKIIPLETSKALSLLKREKMRFGLVFVDPPYNCSMLAETLKGLYKNELLTYNSIVVAEHSIMEVPPDRLEGLNMEDRRKYGDTLVSFYIFNKKL
ncbi:MAG: 16S rRNA (guanine(966)-N(2))-methyltransferase RsmD [Thermodesulfobacteriota bacterium]